MMLKKKKTQGFTLIELLAVIVILVIIAYVAFLIIVKVTNKAKVKGFQITLDNIENWITQQYEMAVYTGNVMDSDSSLVFLEVCGYTGEKCLYSKYENEKKGIVLNRKKSELGETNIEEFQKFIIASGQKASNYSTIIIAIDKISKKSCVKAAMSTTGEFYYDGVIEDGLHFHQSTSCSLDAFEGLTDIITNN